MKRVLWVILCALWASPASAQWAVADSDSLYSAGSSSTIQLTMTVGAGNFVYVCAASDSEPTAITSIKLNGTETLNLFGPYSDSIESKWIAFSLASTQAGSVTIDVTYASPVTGRLVAAFVMTHNTGTVSLDTGASNAAVSSAIDTSTWTATGSDLAAYACTYTSVNITAASQQINGVSASAAIVPAGYGAFSLWWGPVSAGSVIGSAAIGSGAFWVASGVSFNVTAAGGSVPKGTLSTLGVGR